MGGRRGTPAQRFWPKVDILGPDDCWDWQAGMAHGYGSFNVGDGRGGVRASTVAWELTYGPVPEGYDVHHRCRRKSCCNPAHLELLPALDHRKLHGGDPHKGGKVPTPCPHGNKRGECNACRRATRKPAPRKERGPTLRGAHNRAKETCPAGHPYDETNTRWDHGRRRCRQCEADQRAARKAHLVNPMRQGHGH